MPRALAESIASIVATTGALRYGTAWPLKSLGGMPSLVCYRQALQVPINGIRLNFERREVSEVRGKHYNVRLWGYLVDCGSGRIRLAIRIILCDSFRRHASSCVAALRARDHTEPESGQDEKRIGRLVGIASGVEGVAILVAVNVLANTGTQDYTAPAIGIVVGLHFLPLARWLPAKLYYAKGIALIGLGVIGIWISGPVLRLEVVCSGSACILWVTSVLVLTTKPKSDIGIGHSA